MKVSRLGINMYELEDSIPGGGSPVGRAVNFLRVEVNKIAEILDEMDERISRVSEEWQMINHMNYNGDDQPCPPPPKGAE
jgi:isocitrate dehydrogenase